MSEIPRIPFADCQGLAGAWTLGTAQTDRFELHWRAGQPAGNGAAFGDPVIVANLGFLQAADGFEMQGTEAHNWNSDIEVGYVCGTPPCSGFSLMNASKKGNRRGPDSPINSCMKDLAKYGGRVSGLDGKRGAEVVAFESVQQAFSSGRKLMLALRDIIERESGAQYALTHVKMSGASVGAAQYRHRYFFVAHRIPFQVAHPEPRHVVTYRDALEDLMGLENMWEAQPYVQNVDVFCDFAERLRSSSGEVTAHASYTGTRDYDLLMAVVGRLRPGQSVKDLIENDLETTPKILLDRFPYTKSDWKELRGWQWFKRVDADKPGFVITGGGAGDFVHWEEPRFLTVRECSRLMGYPDDWEWPVAPSVNNGSTLIGKCCPVESGQWISEAVADAIEGNSQKDPLAEEIGDREYLHNSSLDYRRWPEEISGWKYRDIAAAAG